MDPLLITHPLNGLLMLALSIALGVYLVRRFRLSWWLWWMGATTFVLSQIGHIPFNAALTALFRRGILPAPPENYQLLTNAIILGLSAGLWEELLRYATYRWWATDARSWRKGLLLGAGHGGIEAILLGGLVLVTFFTMLGLRGADLAGVVPPEQLELARAQVAQYWGAPWWFTLFGGLERLFAMTMHLALSLLVLQAFTRRNFGWVWLAVLFHAAANATMLLVQGTLGNLAGEAAVGVFALSSLGIIYALYRPEPAGATGVGVTGVTGATGVAGDAPVHQTLLQLQPVEPEPDQIEDSRYN